MMPFGSSLSVVTALPTVTSAFRDADSLLQQIKVRCVGMRINPPPPLLEQIINQAPDEIERAKQHGMERFGRAFEQGDQQAVIDIQHVTIQLQIGLLPSLRAALATAEPIDFNPIINHADLAKDGILAAFISLRQRLMSPSLAPGLVHPAYEPAHALPNSPPSSPPASPPIMHAAVMPPNMPPSMPHNVPPTPAQNVPAYAPVYPPMYESTFEPTTSRQASVSSQNPVQILNPAPSRESRGRGSQWNDPYFPDRAYDSDASSRTPVPGEHRRNSSFFGRFKRQPTNGSLSPTYENEGEGRFRRSLRPSPSSATQHSIQSSRSVSPMPGPSTISESHEGSGDPPDPRVSNLPSPSVYSTLSHSSTSDKSRAASVLSTPASTAPPPSSHQTHAPTIVERLTNPSSDNDYLGFCPGAWRVQVNDAKAMIDRRDFTQSAQSSVAYPSCSKCHFRGHINTKIIWNKVVEDEVRGIKYRWAFMAKSHVKQKNIRERNYGYQCVFCVFMGQTEQVVYSQEAYLDHVSQNHRNQALDGVLLWRTNCINDRVCENTEKFDINIFPIRRGPARSKSDGLMEGLTIDLKTFELE